MDGTYTQMISAYLKYQNFYKPKIYNFVAAMNKSLCVAVHLSSTSRCI